MNPTEQRGYDAQIAGVAHPAPLMGGDTDEARDYRAGVRAARREQAAITLGEPVARTVAVQASEVEKLGTIDVVAPGWMPPLRKSEADAIVGAINERLDKWVPRPDPPTPISATPNAFADPSPGRKRHRRAGMTKDDDAGQLGLL